MKGDWRLFALTVAFPFTNKEVSVRYTKTLRPSNWLKTVIKVQSANLIKMSAIIIYIFLFVKIKIVGALMK